MIRLELRRGSAAPRRGAAAPPYKRSGKPSEWEAGLWVGQSVSRTSAACFCSGWYATPVESALERRFPGLAGRLPRVPLTALPTPVGTLGALARARGLGRVWIKRDDRSGHLYGGNKPRKLEFLLGEARRRGRRTVMTFGGIGSHHGLATAVCARAVGMRTVLVLVPQPVTAHTLHCLLLDQAYGAELHYAASVSRAAARALALLAHGALRGDPPFIIPTGGTSTLGTIGYVNAALELAEQVRAGELPAPEAIFVPLGSGGTVAGLLLGLKLAVLVTDILPPSPGRLVRLARATLGRLRRLAPEVPPVAVTAAELTVVTGYLGRCYGAPTDAGVAAQQLAAEVEGLQLETTYTAKCLAALLDLASRPPYREQDVLFWNTYSSVDPAASLARLPDWRELPPAFHRFFRGVESHESRANPNQKIRTLPQRR